MVVKGFLERLLLPDLDDASPEVGLDGWDELPESYAFTYIDTTGANAAFTFEHYSIFFVPSLILTESGCL